MQGVRVQVSARERLLRPETRNLKPGTRKTGPSSLDPRHSILDTRPLTLASLRIESFGFE